MLVVLKELAGLVPLGTRRHSQRFQYPLIKEHALNYRGLDIIL